MGQVCECPKCQAKRAASAMMPVESEEQPPIPDDKMVAADEGPTEALRTMGALRALGHLLALQLQRAQGERDKLLRDIEAAARAQDSVRLADLQRAKSNLDKELRKFGHP